MLISGPLLSNGLRSRVPYLIALHSVFPKQAMQDHEMEKIRQRKKTVPQAPTSPTFADFPQSLGYQIHLGPHRMKPAERMAHCFDSLRRLRMDRK